MVADLIGMAFIDGLRGEKEAKLFRFGHVSYRVVKLVEPSVEIFRVSTAPSDIPDIWWMTGKLAQREPIGILDMSAYWFRDIGKFRE